MRAENRSGPMCASHENKVRPVSESLMRTRESKIGAEERGRGGKKNELSRFSLLESATHTHSLLLIITLQGLSQLLQVGL